MRALYGICNHGLYETHLHLRMLVKTMEKKPRIQVLGFGDELDEKARLVLIPTVALFRKKMAQLRKTKAVVFVFDSPVLCEYLKPIELLDVLPKKVSYAYTFKPIDRELFNAKVVQALANKEPIKVESQSVDHIPTLLNEQLSSILNPILNFLYRVRDTDKRHRYQKVIYLWLVSKGNLTQLRKELLNIADSPKKEPVAVTELLEVLATEKFAKMKPAFEAAFETKVGTNGKKKAVNTTKLCKQFGVDKFDLRYTLKAIRKFGSYREVMKDVQTLYREVAANGKAKKTKSTEEETV